MKNEEFNKLYKSLDDSKKQEFLLRLIYNEQQDESHHFLTTGLIFGIGFMMLLYPLSYGVFNNFSELPPDVIYLAWVLILASIFCSSFSFFFIYKYKKSKDQIYMEFSKEINPDLKKT